MTSEPLRTQAHQLSLHNSLLPLGWEGDR